MKKMSGCALALAGTLTPAHAPVARAQDAPPPSRILAPGAQVEKLAGDFIFTEGPTSDKDGNVKTRVKGVGPQ